MSALLIPIRLLSQDALGAAERRAAAVDAEAAAQAAAVQETLRELGAEVMGGFDVSQGIFEGEGSEDLMEQVAEAEAEVREPARLLLRHGADSVAVWARAAGAGAGGGPGRAQREVRASLVKVVKDLKCKR